MSQSKLTRADLSEITIYHDSPIIFIKELNFHSRILDYDGYYFYFYSRFKALDFLNIDDKKVNRDEAIKLMQLFLEKFDTAMVFI